MDATTDEEIAHQIASDSDSAPIFSEAEIQSAQRMMVEPIEDVRSLRTRLGLSQEGFARRYGFSVAAIRQYESGRRKPSGPVRILLRVIAREPDAVTRALLSDA